MNSLEDPCIAAALDNLHRRAARDWVVFAGALPGVIGSMLGGKRLGVGHHFETIHYVTVLKWSLT